MNELTYRALVWLIYRLAATFAAGVPLVLLIWSAWRREPLVLRLLGIYWKVASLMAISLLLLTDQRPPRLRHGGCSTGVDGDQPVVLGRHQ